MGAEIVMYSTATCPYCERAKRLLTKKGVAWREVRVDQQEDGWTALTELTGRRTVPQIFIGERHVGGFDDLAELDADGELDPLLEPIRAAAR